MFDEGFYRKFRAIIPSNFLKWIDRYNYESAELQNLIGNNNKPLSTHTLDLSIAQTMPREINFPGRGFALYGYVTSDATRTVVVDFLVNVRINKDLPETQYPGKHQRGYRGDFVKLFLYWPAQPGVTVDLVVHNFDDRPWQGGQEAS